MVNGNIISLFDGFQLKIQGLAYHKQFDGNTIIAVKECGEYKPVDVECESGYIRVSGKTVFAKREKISCDEWLYRATTRLALVVFTKKYNLDSLCDALLFRLTNDDITVVNTNIDKDIIESEEKLKANTFDLIKITFDYSFDYIPKCEENDIECC